MIVSGSMGVCMQFSETKILDLLLIAGSRVSSSVNFALFGLYTC